jgi:hypothetical protein
MDTVVIAFDLVLAQFNAPTHTDYPGVSYAVVETLTTLN